MYGHGDVSLGPSADTHDLLLIAIGTVAHVMYADGRRRIPSASRRQPERIDDPSTSRRTPVPWERAKSIARRQSSMISCIVTISITIITSCIIRITSIIIAVPREWAKSPSGVPKRYQ